MSGFYQTSTPRIFTVQDPVLQMQANLALLRNNIDIPERTVTYDSADPVVYLAKDLMDGYIIRTGHGTNNVTDSFDSATNIIAALKGRIQSIAGAGHAISSELKNGTSVKCKLYNITGSPNNGDLRFYSDIPSYQGVRIGGNTNQIVGEATAILEIVVQDQASLGAGHEDTVFVCISRCAAAISYD
jgi:hypothetical protein